MSLLYPEEGKDGQTERASEKKKKEERKKGTVCMSNEVINVLVICGAVIMFQLILPFLRGGLIRFMEDWTQVGVSTDWNVHLVQALMKDGLKVCAICILPIGLAAIATSTVASIAQTKPYFEPEAMKLKFDQLNPMTGAKQLFSPESIVKMFLSIFKVVIISIVVWGVIRGQLMQLLFLHRLNVADGVHWYLTLLNKIVWRVLVLYILIAVLDWIKEKRKYERKLMMTKQQVKDERKNQESSPHVKNKLRQKMRELSMARMMAAVPDAAIVITNPTHLAIAIKYDSTMNAPVVVAKGKRLTAKRIREIARENGVPVIERKPLARAIYANVKVGQSLPGNFFEAVAELLAYLYRIGNSHVRRKLT